MQETYNSKELYGLQSKVSDTNTLSHVTIKLDIRETWETVTCTFHIWTDRFHQPLVKPCSQSSSHNHSDKAHY